MQAFLGNWHAASMARSDERPSQPLNGHCSMTMKRKTKTKYQSRNQNVCGQDAQSASSVISSLMASATHKPYRVKLNHMICSRCAGICKQEVDGRWISFNLYMGAVYMSCMTSWLPTAHRCVWSHWQVKAALRGLTSSLRNSAPDRLSENEGSTSMYIMPFIDRWDEIGGFENTRHTALKHHLEAGYQAIVAMLP